jgi:hypothetical protein
VAFQISLGVVAVASRNDGRDLDCGVLIFPVTPLAAWREREARFPKVFEEIADFPWHRETIPILGRVATSIYATTDRHAVSDNVSECLEGGEDAGDLIGALFVFSSEAGGEGFGVLADGGQEFAEGGDLGGEIGGPSPWVWRFVNIES